MPLQRQRSSLPPPDGHETGAAPSPNGFRRAVLDHLYYTCATDRESASRRDLWVAIAHALRDRLLHRWLATRRTYREQNVKRVYYLSAEYLLGRLMSENLLSLGLRDVAARTLAAEHLDLADLLEEERDPGLGNGGLGRLAACFLDSMATLGLPGFGYGIRYEYGIFEQEIADGRQVEKGDAWLRKGCPWEIPRYELAVPVSFYGREDTHTDATGRTFTRWVDAETVVGVPYDVPIAGYGNATVNTLRLWSARASNEFNLELFNAGDYRRAVEEKVSSETISRVLYPADHSQEGKELRLKQQYFFVRCSISDIVRRYRHHHAGFEGFPDKVAIQLNDTHPSIAIAELMRVFLDDERMEWEPAWDLTQRTFGYTNHTLMPEALEKWPLDMFGRLLPRHLSIIYEINARMLRHVHIRRPNDYECQRRMSIIEEAPERAVRMAHLAVVGSHSVNGVAKLHTDLIRSRLLPDFAQLWPERFNNKTNGVSPRRWLLVANPALSDLFTRYVGKDWSKDLSSLRALTAHADDPALHAELRAIKRTSKRTLAEHLLRPRTRLPIDPSSMFVVQVKRIHEYKRQLLACLDIVQRYARIKRGKLLDPVPRTYLFGGKAAPGYVAAKEHIKLINDVASILEEDALVRDVLRVVFVPNYGVSLAEKIIPAADLSVQISLAGYEASGTGNMKLGMNGALTIGTLDGANVEIREKVGAKNFFLFGMDAETVLARKRQGYDPSAFIERSPGLEEALSLIEEGFFNPDERRRHRGLVESIRRHDEYMCCADFDAYVAAQDEVDRAFRDPARWGSMVVSNIANLGDFSSDRTILEYAADVWRVGPIDVHIGAIEDD